MTPPKPAGSDGSAAAGPSLLPCSGQTGFRKNSTPSTLRLRGCLPPTFKLAEAWSPDSVSAKTLAKAMGALAKTRRVAALCAAGPREHQRAPRESYSRPELLGEMGPEAAH